MEQRLQKLIAEAGVASRRAAEEMIAAGEVTVNGETVREMGVRADPERDHIKVRGKLINPLLRERQKIYVLINKPRGYLTSLSDDVGGRPLVTELLPGSLGRLHTVGRLDFNTEGLLIFTNDGELTNFITSARNKVAKVYEAKVQGHPAEAAIERLRRGVRLDDGERTAPAQIRKLDDADQNTWFEVIIYQGINNQIRRMFEVIGHNVLKLRRTRIGHLRDDRLRTGEWRYLTPEEVARLKKPSSDESLATRERREDERAADKRARERQRIARDKAQFKREQARLAQKKEEAATRRAATKRGAGR